MDGWSDQLVDYNGESCVYDEIGNPTTYRGKIATWKYGRQLASLGNISYTYNASGLRQSKTVNGMPTQYLWDGSNILAQYDDSNSLTYRYGADGICGVNHIGTEYSYIKNIQGDVTHILDINGSIVGKYIYDAWGNHKAYSVVGGVESLVYDSTAVGGAINPTIFSSNLSGNNEPNAYGVPPLNGAINSIVSLNPIRYRSYYYDQDSNLYYLQSRYYDSTIGRFINADDISYLAPESLNGLNLYAYCMNNPVMYTDDGGNMPNWLKWLIGGIAFAGALALTVLTGGALAPVFIGMGVSIVSSGLIQGGINASNGGSFWQGFADGMADGALLGGVFALGGAVVRTVQIFKNGVVIGQTMDRVNGAAKQIGAATYKSPGKQLVKLFTGKKATNIMLNQNARWINRMMKWGIKISDIGANTLRSSSMFYAMELTATAKYWNLVKMFWPALL